MKHTVLARSYSGVRQRSRPYTAAELRLSAPPMEEAQVVDLDVFANAYRQGVERAECLCRQVFGGLRQRAAGNQP